MYFDILIFCHYMISFINDMNFVLTTRQLVSFICPSTLRTHLVQMHAIIVYGYCNHFLFIMLSVSGYGLHNRLMYRVLRKTI